MLTPPLPLPYKGGELPADRQAVAAPLPCRELPADRQAVAAPLPCRECLRIGRR